MSHRPVLAAATLLAASLAAPAALAKPADFVWWEAESAQTANFSGSSDFGTATFGKQIGLLSGSDWLTNDTVYTGTPVKARYSVNVPKVGTYQFWVRKFWQHGPFAWHFGSTAWDTCTNTEPLQNTIDVRKYLDLDWVDLGQVRLTAGTHAFELELLGVQGEKLPAGMDCFVLAHGVFKPNGAKRPTGLLNDAVSVSPRYVVRDSVLQVLVTGADSGEALACAATIGAKTRQYAFTCGAYEGRYAVPLGVQSGVVYKVTVASKAAPARSQTSEGYIVRRDSSGAPAAVSPELAIWIDLAEHPQPLQEGSAITAVYPMLDTALRKVGDPYQGLKGFQVRAAWSAHWERLIPYQVYIPRALDLAKPAGLLVYLHGHGNGFQNIYNNVRQGQNYDAFPMITIGPAGTLGNGYTDIGLANVMEVLRDAIAKYPVDTTRIYLFGESMGGNGAQQVARRFPDQFTGVASSVGTWFDVIEPTRFSRQPAVSRALVTREWRGTYLVNLAHLPSLYITGTMDGSFTASAMAVNVLKQLGAKVELKVLPTGHGIPAEIFDRSYVREFMGESRRLPAASRSHVRLRANTLRFATSGWVTVDGISDWYGVADVDCRYDSATATVVAAVSNVSAMTLTPPAGATRMVVNGVALPARGGQVSHLTFTKGKPAVAAQRAVAPTHKNARRSGPILDALYRPFVLVYGTRGNRAAALAAWCRRSSLEGAATWTGVHGGQPPRFKVLADTAALADSAMLKRYNLVCFGNTAENALVGRLNAKDRPNAIDTTSAQNAIQLWVRPSPYSDSTYALIAEAKGEAVMQKPTWLHWESDWVLFADGLLTQGMYGTDWAPEKVPQ